MTDIVERLRSSEPLPACPYDRLSPHYQTAPNDKPCAICGGLNEPDAPDLCRGADTRIMGEAADEIERLRDRVRELEQPQSTALTISPLTEAFHQFKLAYISAGGARNPKSPDAKGWRPAELVFNRLVRKDKHDPQAIITGTQAYAEYMRKVIARDPSKIAYVPAPKPFLNGEQFMQAWDRANPTTPSGSQRGAPTMFDVAQSLGRTT